MRSWHLRFRARLPVPGASGEGTSRSGSFMRVSQVVAATILILAFVVGFWVVEQQGPLDIQDWPSYLRDEIGKLGWWAPFAFIAIASVRIFILLPSFVVMSAGGMLFGVWQGMVCSTIGFSFGSMIVFLLARGVGRDVVQARMRPGRLAAADAFLSGRGAPWLCPYTAIPFTPLTPMFAFAGLSGMPFRSFSLWVTLGLVPRTALYSFFGDSLAEGGDAIVQALLVLGAAMLLGLYVVRRIQQARKAPPGDASDEGGAQG